VGDPNLLLKPVTAPPLQNRKVDNYIQDMYGDFRTHGSGWRVLPAYKKKKKQAMYHPPIIIVLRSPLNNDSCGPYYVTSIYSTGSPPWNGVESIQCCG
jgi:hypothetical protein